MSFPSLFISKNFHPYLFAVLVLGMGFLSPKDYLLIYMDEKQNNHLKAYGVAYNTLRKTPLQGEWLLNYRNGSFLFPKNNFTLTKLIEKDVNFDIINQQKYQSIQTVISSKNMSSVKIKQAPKVAIYTPPNVSPWADAVTLVMTYAEIPYTPIYDKEILNGDLTKYDWVHLHHEDFTAQYSKFWRGHRHTKWFQEKVNLFKRSAKQANYQNVAEHKKAVARKIRKAVGDGLFLFAMCTATETLDLALAAEKIDIVPLEIDGTPIVPHVSQQLNFEKTLAFQKFQLENRIQIISFSDIDYNQVNVPNLKKEVSDFILFDFSAKLDPIPTLLNQNHSRRIRGFFGQTTTFNSHVIKDGVTILASSINESHRYLTGKYGKGYFTFYGGHEPEDKHHYVGDKEPNIEAYKNSPGYRLILNNILFPSADPPPKKT